MRHTFLAIALGLPLAASTGGTAAASLEVGALGGVQLSHDVLTGNDKSIDAGISAGLRTGYAFSPRWSWFADALISTIDTAEGGGIARTITVRTGAELLLDPRGAWRWFLTGGAGALDVDFRNDGSRAFQRAIVSGGIGQRFGARPGLRWELRGDLTLGDEGMEGARYTQGQLLVGIDWGGSRAPHEMTAATARVRQDSDGDGVDDRRDLCAATPPGLHVNSRGCPKDADGDGVADELDQCPGTPTGTTVGGDGCPSDSDHDGIADGQDACADTPHGAFIDESGCPIDSDGDGVPEGLDLCLATPAGAVVDVNGCQRDEDSDGVPDGIDQCPGTPLSSRVDQRGCPREP